MNINRFKFIITTLLLTAGLAGFGQKKEDSPKASKLHLESAQSLEGVTLPNGEHIRKVKGNVHFTQDGTSLFCDSAFQYTQMNAIDAFGHIRIQQGDSLTVTGETLHYDGNTKLAEIKGHVVLINKKTRVTTDQLNYQTDARTAYYSTGAQIRDGQNTLTSKIGSYNADTEFFGFKKDVRLHNPQYNIDCDTLNYSGKTKIAYFHGPTNIHSKSGRLFAKDGEYHTITGESYFSRNAAIENNEYRLIGDKLHYDDQNSMGNAEGNIELTLKGQNIIIYGDKGFYDEKTGRSQTHGNVLMKYVMNNDTLYLKADTLQSFQSGDSLKKINAFPNVRIFRDDLRGKCDSLSYIVSDSTIYFYSDPILWSAGSQLTGEQIKVTLRNNEMDKMYVDRNAFMVSLDSIKNFNQIKGKNMVAHFLNGDLNVLDVFGNGQSLYFALEGDTSLVGLNTTICSNMKIYMDSNTVKDIMFFSQPDAHFIPPQEIADPDRKLPGFIWRKKEEPLFGEFRLNRNN